MHQKEGFEYCEPLVSSGSARASFCIYYFFSMMDPYPASYLEGPHSNQLMMKAWVPWSFRAQGRAASWELILKGRIFTCQRSRSKGLCSDSPVRTCHRLYVLPQSATNTVNIERIMRTKWHCRLDQLENLLFLRVSFKYGFNSGDQVRRSEQHTQVW